MTPDEFKAWFQGYTEDKDELTAEQLERIHEQVQQLTATVYTWTLTHQPPWPIWPSPPPLDPVFPYNPTTSPGTITVPVGELIFPSTFPKITACSIAVDEPCHASEEEALMWFENNFPSRRYL